MKYVNTKKTKKNTKDNKTKRMENKMKRGNLKTEMSIQTFQRSKKKNISKHKKQKDVQIIEKEENEPWVDLDIGNIENEEKTGKENQRIIPKIHQIQQGFKMLKKEKEFLNQLIPEDKKKAEHLLAVQKAIQKSQGEKVYTEKALKNKLQRILKKKEKSKKKWESKPHQKK